MEDYQTLILAAAALALGVLLLIKGGDWTIDAATFVAQRANLSPLFIGATIISFGTSLPELFTSVNANMSGFPGVSLGNVIGSNIANVLLVLGVVATIFTIAANRGSLIKDMVVMLAATAVLVAGVTHGVFERWMGLVMFGALVAFVIYQALSDPGDLEAEVEQSEISSSMTGALMLIGGLAALAIGSEILVQGAVAAGDVLGVPEAVIGMTAIAFGTSLPELATCITAARRGSTGFILGNIIGSNTFNILSIIGLTAAIKPLTVDPTLADADIWFMTGVSVVFAVWMLTVGRLNVIAGVAMIAAYLGFVGLQYS